MASEPFVNQMRRGNVNLNASRKTFKNIGARFHTFHRMGASQEQAVCFNAFLWYFWLTIQNTANRHVGNAFDLLGVFISFPLARCAPPPHPAPLFWGRESTKKAKKMKIVGVGEVVVSWGRVLQVYDRRSR